MAAGDVSQKVHAQLGCGTLIIIALIVLFFSGRGDVREMHEELQSLRDQVTRLEAKIDSLSTQLGASDLQ